MALMPLNIPQGVYRNGTEFQASNRWRDVNLIRWTDANGRVITEPVTEVPAEGEL